MINWKYFDPKFEYEDKFPDVDEISAWVGHKYFIYDFVRNVKPKVITELGTHYGTSFFSMCQAIKDGKLNTKLYAVDTWKGDKHTKFYDETIFIKVNEIKHTHYPKLKIKLLRKTFNRASKQFKSNSIDLLHIDGLHTYEAVKHDFENWFSKVRKDGIVIFHDTHEKRDDFGVHKLWGELKKRFKTLEFSHAHGLGILFKNPKPFARIFNFQQIWKHYYPLVFENKLFKKQINNLNSQLSQKQVEIDSKDKKLRQLEKKLEAIEKEKQKGAEELQQKNENIRQQIKQTRIHIQNLELTLNKIKSAKFFKLWQRYCKIMKLLKLKS